MRRTAFARTPAFGWNPVPGAVSYDFQLAMSSTFRQSGLVFEQLDCGRGIDRRMARRQRARSSTRA